MKWTRWTEALIRDVAKTCKNRREFHDKYRGAEKAAIKLGIYDSIFNLGKILWTNEMLAIEASKYKTRSEFSRGSSSAYTIAARRGLLNAICPKAKTSNKLKWTRAAVKTEAAKYKSRTEFEDLAVGAYAAARRYGVLDDICPTPLQGVSGPELELLEWLKTLSSDFCTKRFSNDYELDAYSPSLRIGIEYNGHYWHSELNKPRNYHLKKTRYFESRGIRLIHIWEYEWRDRRAQVEDFIRSACGGNSIRIGARKCVFKPIESAEARSFLDNTHIQGSTQVRYAVGCYYNGILTGVCAFGQHHRKQGEIVLNRFACLPGHTVAGFLAKASKMAAAHFNTVIYSWAHIAKSQGSGYLKAGWQTVAVSTPDYFYSNSKGKYISKQSRRKSSVNTPKSMTEYAHAQKDGLYRIWDCGKIKLAYYPIPIKYINK